MLQKITVFTGLFATLLALNVANAEPMNLSILKKQLEQYHDNGQYEQDISQVVNQAEKYLSDRVKANQKTMQPKKLAIVFDIDETALSNYKDMKAIDFGGTPKMFDEEQSAAADPAIRPTLELYRLAEKDDVAVFFVTGRKQYLRAATEKNLRDAGYTHWQDLVLKAKDYNQSSVVPYKSSARANIEKSGYDIIVNIGDQYSDLDGGYADKTFKLPNPFYFIP